MTSLRIQTESIDTNLIGRLARNTELQVNKTGFELAGPGAQIRFYDEEATQPTELTSTSIQTENIDVLTINGQPIASGGGPIAQVSGQFTGNITNQCIGYLYSSSAFTISPTNTRFLFTVPTYPGGDITDPSLGSVQIKSMDNITTYATLSVEIGSPYLFDTVAPFSTVSMSAGTYILVLNLGVTVGTPTLRCVGFIQT